jgi:hypothetical protein
VINLSTFEIVVGKMKITELVLYSSNILVEP